jgi:superfamily I DNA/RNA helicase
MLLSDISQSSGKEEELDYPKGKQKIVTLTEVVRSSQRIVEAASAFQLGDSVHKISCQHSAAGPPLKAFMFNLEGAVPDAVTLNMKDFNYDQVRQYAGQTVEAIKHVISMFGSLRLHDRVAIVVDEAILKDFRGTSSGVECQGGLLGAELLEHFTRRESATKHQIEAGHARSFQIIDATQAASMVMGGSQDDREWLIVDTVEAFDGLERLVVIAVGLDAKIVEGGASTLETRSLLYRAMTRAHMLAIVVQHNIPGGFFAFLHQVKLDESAEFDAAKAQKARDSTALNKMMTKASSAEPQSHRATYTKGHTCTCTCTYIYMYKSIYM